MSLAGAYDDNNVFAKILRGELPAAKVYEDDDVLAFMDVFPESKGHVLVIPKRSRSRNILDIEPAALAKVTAAVQKVAHAVNAALKPDGLIVKQYNGVAGGQSVFHLHFHVIPRWDGVEPNRHGGVMADAQVLAGLAAGIAAHLE